MSMFTARAKSVHEKILDSEMVVLGLNDYGDLFFFPYTIPTQIPEYLIDLHIQYTNDKYFRICDETTYSTEFFSVLRDDIFSLSKDNPIVDITEEMKRAVSALYLL